MNGKSARKALAVFLASALASACSSQQPSSSWTGTWKLNPSKGNFQGPILTISISADGEYRYDNQYLNSTFRCDGKERPTGNNRTIACVKTSATTLDLTRKENGTKTKTSHWELSADGKILTATSAAGQLVALRMSGSNDFAGQWRDTTYLQQHATMTLSLDNQTVHMSYPNIGQYIDARLDGIETAVRGPHDLDGLTYTATLVRPGEILMLAKRNGKAFNQESLELGNDGRAITYSWWNPDRPSDRATLVYEKQ